MAKNKIAITSFYIGIAATAFGIIECFLPLIILGAVLGIIAIVLGILFLVLQGIKFEFWDKYRYFLSFLVLFLLTIVFIITLQPYAASLTLIILIIELLLKLKIK